MPRKKDKFVNRELSWLEFNQRVLDEARDPALPLLERLNFLAITASNLDEFFMVRVGGLQLITESGLTRRDPAGWTACQQLDAIARRVQRMTDEQYACYAESLEPGLVDAGIVRVRPAELTAEQRRHVQQVFEETMYPVVTPMRVDQTDDQVVRAQAGDPSVVFGVELLMSAAVLDRPGSHEMPPAR